MQLVLNEWSFKLDEFQTITASAYSQARQNLSYTAFIELNQGITNLYYQEGTEKRWKGHRLLGIDGSKIRLPENNAIESEFGRIHIKNQFIEGYYTAGLASVCYDVLNHMVIDGTLAHSCAYEVDLAQKHLAHTNTLDIHIMDRNYAEYLYWATLAQQNKPFLCRCSKTSFKAVQMMFKTNAPKSRQVTIQVPKKKESRAKKLGLPLTLSIRLIRLTLKTGEIEVLATSLLDKKLYPYTDFNDLYFMRWGIETFYGTIKGRLDLENFTGSTVEAIKQDFYATLFISNLESVLSDDVQAQLDKKSQSLQYRQQVNHAVSFNAIKNKVFDLLFTEGNEDTILTQLEQLFGMNPVPIRENRTVVRKKSQGISSLRKKLGYHKRQRKVCF